MRAGGRITTRHGFLGVGEEELRCFVNLADVSSVPRSP